MEELLNAYDKFQSTLPRGERLQQWKMYQDLICRFNPRSRGGSDWSEEPKIAHTSGVSIHAPAGGATVYSGYPFPAYMFQSTLPRGERLSNSFYV